VLSAPALTPSAAQEIGVLLGHELQHVTVLERALRALGATVPAAPRDEASVQKALGAYDVSASIADLDTQHDCVRLLVDLESVLEAAYFSALSKLHDPALLGTALEIMGCEAQHWTFLSTLQHHGDVKIAVPYPFVQGSM
jgi:hypothetical protein